MFLRMFIGEKCKYNGNDFQFDEFPIDRPVILKRMYQLFNCMADRKVLDFRFFAGRFDAIVAELKESDQFRSSFKKRSSTTAAAMASEAVASAQSSVPAHTSLRTRLSRCSTMSGEESAANTPGCEVRSLSSGLKFPYKRTISAPVGMGLSPVSKANLKLTNSSTSSSAHQSAYLRQQSLPMRGRLLHHHSKSPHELHKQVSSVGSAGAGALGSSSGGLPEESEYANVAAKTLDMDEIDKESLHLLVFLFMQFLSHPEMAKVPEGHGQGHGNRQGGDHGEHKEHHKTSQAVRNVHVAAMNRCFQCLYSLLGYNEVERRFQGLHPMLS